MFVEITSTFLSISKFEHDLVWQCLFKFSFQLPHKVLHGVIFTKAFFTPGKRAIPFPTGNEFSFCEWIAKNITILFDAFVCKAFKYKL